MYVAALMSIPGVVLVDMGWLSYTVSEEFLAGWLCLALNVYGSNIHLSVPLI
jgi:hypothetical protein